MSKLFDVTSQATLQDCMTENNGAEVRVPWGSGIVGHVAQSGCPLNIPEAYEVSVYLSLFVFLYNEEFSTSKDSNMCGISLSGVFQTTLHQSLYLSLWPFCSDVYLTMTVCGIILTYHIHGPIIGHK